MFLNAAIHSVYIRQIKGLSSKGAYIKNSSKKHWEDILDI